MKNPEKSSDVAENLLYSGQQQSLYDEEVRNGT